MSKKFYVEPESCNIDAMTLAINSAIKIAKEVDLDVYLILPEKRQMNSKVVRSTMKGLRHSIGSRSDVAKGDSIGTIIKGVSFTISHSGLANKIPSNSIVIGAWGGDRILDILDSASLNSYRILLNWNTDKTIFPDERKEDIWIKGNNAIQINPAGI